MPDAQERIKKGERAPFFGRETLGAGTTLTIQGTAKCTLYDSAGVAVTDFSAINCTAQTSGASETVTVVYDLDTDASAIVAGQTYTMVFDFTTLGSDSYTREHHPSVSIYIEPVTS
mgnify:CR=1 FL=1